MIATSIKELRVAACLPFEAEKPGFALPIFEYSDAQKILLVQEIDEYRNVVKAFKPLSGDLTGAITISDGATSRVGAPQLFVFITEDEIAHCGTLAGLELTLRAFQARCLDRPSISLQIAELIGSTEEKRVARARMRTLIGEETNEAAAHAFYERSVLCSALWDGVIASAVDESAAERILLRRSRLGVKIEGNKILDLDLSAVKASDYAGERINALKKVLQMEVNAVVPAQQTKGDFDAPSDLLRRRRPELVETESRHRLESETAWADSWMATWASTNDSRRRTELKDAAIQWLKAAALNDANWPTVWITTWTAGYQEKDVSSLALNWLSETAEDSHLWIGIWSKLWEHARTMGHRAGVSLDQLGKLANKWLLKVEYSNSRWASTWRKVWTVDLRGRSNLAGLGHRWLEQVDKTHAGWGYVWGAIWDYRGDTDRNDLLHLGIQWLLTVRVGHGGWSTVWSRAWSISIPRNVRDELVSVALVWIDNVPVAGATWVKVWRQLWHVGLEQPRLREDMVARVFPMLDRNSNEAACGHAWATFWKTTGEDAKIRRRLITWAQMWLRERREEPIWGAVWQELSRAVTDRQTREVLLDEAMRWLRRNREREDWAFIWTQVSATDQESRHTYELVREGETWLRENVGHNSWIIVWDGVLLACGHDSVRRRELFDVGKSVLNGELSDEIWSNIWRNVWSAASTHDDEDELIGVGLSWIKRNVASTYWSGHWLALWEKKRLRETERSILIEEALNWLDYWGRGSREWTLVWQSLWKYKHLEEDVRARMKIMRAELRKPH